MSTARRASGVRPTPSKSWEADADIVWRASDDPWTSLGELLQRIQPQALGILLPWASQLHRRAYVEARKLNIVSAFSLTSNVPVLTGLMEEIPIEAIVATEEAARAFEKDLIAAGMSERIRGWLIVAPHGTEQSFTARLGETVYDTAL